MNFLIEHHDVGQYAGYKTQVFAWYFYEISDESDIERLVEIYAFAQEKNLSILILSGGTNTLFSRDVFPWIVIKNNLSGWNFDRKTKHLYAASWEYVWNVAEKLEYEYDEPIWHRFIGLPGTFSGAVVWNAGCFGLETASNFHEARVLDLRNGDILTLSQEEMAFDYRSSFLKGKDHLFLLSADFDLSEIREKYSSDVDNIDFRENRQPKGNSCGSFFKNPSREVSAGSLIEQIGFKGHRHGGARWSDLHANFLLSDGKSCKPTDLIELVRMTQEKVKIETGYDLVNEVKIIE